ncbi:MAG: hypothetical protein RJA15_247 [Actinomycetota bacterium]|jgi:hypothetical protein
MNLKTATKSIVFAIVGLSMAVVSPEIASAATTQYSSESIAAASSASVELVNSPVIRESRMGVCLRAQTNYNETGWFTTTYLGVWVPVHIGVLQGNIKSWRRAEEDCTSGLALNRTRLYNEVCARAVTSVGPLVYHQSLGCRTTWQYI